MLSKFRENKMKISRTTKVIFGAKFRITNSWISAASESLQAAKPDQQKITFSFLAFRTLNSLVKLTCTFLNVYEAQHNYTVRDAILYPVATQIQKPLIIMGGER
jgi:hypothetical protein